MPVPSMNSKRQRRPSVRLGEVGDIPAAFACEISRKNSTACQNDLLMHNISNQNHLYGFSLESVSPADLQHSIENNNPNSSKSAFDLVNANDTDMAKAKLNFGTITRKSRVMKRRHRSTDVANAWNSKISTGDKKDCNFRNFTRFSSDECSDYKDTMDPDTSAKSKEDSAKEGNLNKLWEEDVFDEGISVSLGSGHGSGEMKFGGSDVNMVSRWLEEKGFGKHVGLFEMHKVDEEALLLLTMEDLKEIGVFAVGPRRKLYSAVQQLRDNV